jgi:hypothetical protein
MKGIAMNIWIYGSGWRSELAEDILERLGLDGKRTTRLRDGLTLVCSLPPRKGPRVEDSIRKGGKAIFLYPERAMLPIFGKELFYSHPFPLLRCCREELPISYLQVLSPPALIRPKGGETWAHFALNFATTAASGTTRYPAVMWRDLGKGKVGIFLYDLLSTVMVFQQGWEWFSSTGDFPLPHNDGRFRSAYLFHGLVYPELSHLPQSYLSELLLLSLMRTVAEEESPLPRIWQYPYPATTALILSGDSDGLEKKRLAQAWKKVAGLKAPYTQFIMEGDLKGFSPKALKAWGDEGIDFGAHYYAGPTPTEKEMESALRKQRDLFQKKKLPFKWSRGHSLIWVGWGEHVDLLEKKGISVDSSICPLGLKGWGTLQGFPYHLYTKSGRSSPLELAVFSSDDATLLDKSGKPPLEEKEALARSIGVLRTMKDLYYQPLNPVFHPHYFTTDKKPNTSEWLEGLVLHAKGKNIPVMNFKNFFSWWMMRGSCSLKCAIEGDNIKADVRPKNNKMAVAFPEEWNGKKFRGEGKELAGTGEILISARIKSVKYE